MNTIMKTQEIAPEVIVSALSKYFPDVRDDLIKKITAMVPFDDTSGDITETIDLYCQATGINLDILQRSHDHRRKLLAILIMFYQPEKLHSFSKRRMKNGIIKGMSDYVGCDRSQLSQWVPDIIVKYRVYVDVREELINIKNKMKNKLK